MRLAWACRRCWCRRTSCSAWSSIAPADDADGIRELNDFEVATRLSYFLWSTMPDDELFELARHGALRKDGNLEKQVRRMLADEKSQALVENFAGQWLQLRNLNTVAPDKATYKGFDEDAAHGDAARDRDVFCHDHARRPQRAGVPGRGLHVRQRAAGQALWHCRRGRRRVPPRVARCRCSGAACWARPAC